MNVSGLGLVNLLKNRDQIIGLEIGCYAGVNAEYLLNSLPQLKLHGVDPYTPYVDWNGSYTCGNNDSAEKQAMDRFSKFPDRFTLHKMTSDDAFNLFPDDYFDFIFIDGLHTYEQVIVDCINYYPKIKTGGLFSGHDFNTISGVNKAVKEFANTNNKTILQTENDVWYWIK